MDVVVTVCATCKLSSRPQNDGETPADGERLAEILDDQMRSAPASIRIRRHDCLWACRRSCAILIQSEGRVGYLAGDFVPDASAAEAIIAWSLAYAETEDGTVPYARWPDGMKGHFIARIPAAGGEKS